MIERTYILHCTDNAIDPETEGDPPKVEPTVAPAAEGEEPEEEDDENESDDDDEVEDEPKGGE